jgi:hypothetical protein
MNSCHKCQSNSCVCNTNKVKDDFPCIDLTCLHVDLFGSPFDCKKQIPTPRFSSPNSPLPPKALDRLQQCIEEANDLLRSLGSESDPDNRRQLQLHFLSIRGADVILKIICKEQEIKENEQEIEAVNRNRQKYIKMKKINGKEIEPKLRLKMYKRRKAKRSIIMKNGKIFTAGRDFIQINEVGASVFVFYDRLISVARDKCEHVKQPEQELIDVNRKVRRELAFNFGDFVSKNPELVNLFFGIPLFKQLKEFLGKDVKVKIFDEEIVGTLVKVDEGSLRILKKNDKEMEINLNEICFVKVFNLK